MKDIGLRFRDADVPADAPPQRAMAEATTLGDVLAAARRQVLPLVVFTVLGLFAGALHHVTSPKQYYTSSTVLVDERSGEMEQEITQRLPFARSDTSLLNEMQVLKSLQLAREVASRLELQDNDAFTQPPSSLAGSIISGVKSRISGLLDFGGADDDTPAPNPDEQRATQLDGAASKLQGDISVSRIGLSFSIEIGYVGADPALAAQIVNTYADAYLEDVFNANMENAERTVEWMRGHLDELEQSSANVLAQAAELRRTDPTKVNELRELAQRAATLDALYKTISARYEQLSIQGSLPVSNGRILTRSIVPKTASLPKLWQSLTVMMLLGLMLGFAVAVLREARERAFRVSTDVVHHAGRTFLGHLPQISSQELDELAASDGGAATKNPFKWLTAQLPGLKTRRTGQVPSKGVGQPDEPVSPLLFWSVQKPQSVFTETLRNIQATVDLAARDEDSKVVAFTSMLPKEGKTTLAVNYANVLARSGVRTLLIDMDLRGAGLSKTLNIPAGPGIAEVLRGTAPLQDALHRLDFTGLHVLGSGPTQQSANAGDALYNHNMPSMIADLRLHYDCIVFDMPSLGKVSDAKAMVPLLDKIVLLCEWGKTPRSLVTQYLSHEAEISSKVAGIALNKVQISQLQTYARPGWPESFLQTDPRVA